MASLLWGLIDTSNSPQIKTGEDTRAHATRAKILNRLLIMARLCISVFKGYIKNTKSNPNPEHGTRDGEQRGKCSGFTNKAFPTICPDTNDFVR
jgi:hypothetical protein